MGLFFVSEVWAVSHFFDNVFFNLDLFIISDESIELKNIRFETIEGFWYDKGVLLSDDTDTAVVNWLETIHFDSWYGFYNY